MSIYGIDSLKFLQVSPTLSITTKDSICHLDILNLNETFSTNLFRVIPDTSHFKHIYNVNSSRYIPFQAYIQCQFFQIHLISSIYTMSILPDTSHFKHIYNVNSSESLHIHLISSIYTMSIYASKKESHIPLLLLVNVLQWRCNKSSLGTVQKDQNKNL